MIFHMDIAKIQYGGQRPGMGRVIFFLREITQKFFLLALSIHILTTRKSIFCHLGGPNGFLAAFWLVLEQKGAILEQISLKIEVL